MIDERFLRASLRFEPPADAFDRLTDRRDHRRRVRRVEAAALAVAAVAAMAIASIVIATGSHRPEPITPPTPTATTPSVRNGEIVVSSAGGLVAVNPENGRSRPLVGCPASRKCTIAPEGWSPDGGRLLYVAIDFRHPGARTNGLYVLDVATGATTEVAKCEGGHGICSGASFSPDGTRIAAIDVGGLEVLDATGATARHLVVSHRRHGFQTLNEPSWSPDGRRIAFVAQRFIRAEQRNVFGIYVVDDDGSNLVKVHEQRRVIESEHWSADGRSIAFESGSSAWSLELLDVDTGKVRALAAGTGHSDGFSWAPDGSSIALVVSGHGTNPGLYLVEPRKNGPPMRIGDGRGIPAWRPLPKGEG